MTPYRVRYKLLLDEMLPRREMFPVTNNFHDLKHVVHDLKYSGAADIKVMKLALAQQRILVTKNIKHFMILCRENTIDMIGVVETMPFEKIDKLIMAHLRKRKHKGMTGEFWKMTI